MILRPWKQKFVMPSHSGSHIQETVHRLTLKAMNAQRIDLESLQRIIKAVMQGVHDGAELQQLQQIANQTQAAKCKLLTPSQGSIQRIGKICRSIQARY
jgi:hypothetical protein